MKITISELEHVLKGAVFKNFNGHETYDSFDIVNIGISYKSNNKLFFATYELNPTINGWIDKPFDKRNKLTLDATLNSSDTYVIENDIISQLSPDSKYIIVDDVYSAIKNIYKYVINIVKPTVIGVTGSVGKTTTVALIEDIIQTKYKCLRIYSKRITPLILFAHILNKIDENIKFVVLEYALYRKNHISILSNLLPPNIVILLNVQYSHIGIDGIKNSEEIFKEKIKNYLSFIGIQTPM